MLFGEDEATSVIAQREDLASNEAVSMYLVSISVLPTQQLVLLKLVSRK